MRNQDRFSNENNTNFEPYSKPLKNRNYSLDSICWPLYPFTLWMIIILSSCSNRKSDLQFQDVYTLDKEVIDISASEIFESFQIIPLETKEIIGEINNLIVTENHLVILDNAKTKSIFLHAIDGSQLGVIHPLGEGPGEYLFPASIAYSEQEESILVYCSLLGKIINYDLNGEFLGEYFLSGESVSDLIVFKGNLYMTLKDGEGRNILGILNYKDGREMEKIPLPNNGFKVSGIKPQYIYKSHNEESFYFKDIYSNSLSEVNMTGEIIGQKTFDLNKDYITDWKGRSLRFDEIIPEIQARGYIVITDEFIDSEGYFLINTEEGKGSGGMLLVDKETYSAKPVRNIINDMDGLYSYTSILGNSTNPGYFIVSMEPSIINLRLDQMEVGLSPYLQKLRSAGLQNDDNPVLIIYKMKTSIESLEK
ncbi:6-bladed beta-propeller [Arthrospiribacter ruber]|nr:6-bladed beta-propeller [Arthrospiribacter ruber]